MSESINTKTGRNDLRWKLLTTVSALVLIASLSATPDAKADDDMDRPTVWIELGGQLSRLNDSQETFAPIFPNSPSRPSIFSPSQKFEQPPISSFDEFGTISFQPDNSNWVFNASVRYGRSAADRHVVQNTSPEPLVKYFPALDFRNTANPVAERFADTKVRNSEQHVILDFTAGKDVGLGLFDNADATSVISAGMRYAQFSSKSNTSLKSDPDWRRNYKYITNTSIGLTHFKISNGQFFHSNLASMTAERSFHGIGPSLSWKASEPLVGNTHNGGIVLDWGLNAAVLFGRQKVRTHHQTTGRYFSHNGPIIRADLPLTTSRLPATPDRTRSRSVTVPNIGGFAGLSFNYANAKISAGYRADLFFGAMDGGIDAAKSENRSFYGPFASVSAGLGG